MRKLVVNTFITLDGVMQAMLQMKKIDIAGLEKAYKG